MSLFFKIIFLLFLQAAKQKGGPVDSTPADLAHCLIASPVILQVTTADDTALEQVLAVCRAYQLDCRVEREIPDQDGKLKTAIAFQNLGFRQHDEMLRAWQHLEGRMELEWIEQPWYTTTDQRTSKTI